MANNNVVSPPALRGEAELDEALTHPSAALIRYVAGLRGPLVVLGAGGKMGPTLCVLAQRAAEAAGLDLPVIAVSRFSDLGSRSWLEERGVQTWSCDLMNREAVASLPDAENVVYLVGLKFGTQQAPARTWAVNTLIPAQVTERYAGARIVALSSGNVYPLTPVARGGSVESDPLTPLGEYANACVARERIFQYASEQHDTPGVLVRLNYAVEPRYGVLVDLARKILAGAPIDVTMGYLNIIGQRDANDMIIRSLDLATVPMRPLNLTGTDILSVRELALRLGVLLDRPVEIIGEEADTALLSNPAETVAALGPPPTPIDTLLRWTAEWVAAGGKTLGKPTHFEVRDGQY